MSPFAIFYIAAQAIERITELFSKIGDVESKEVKGALGLTIRDWRAVWLWVIASALGIGLAFWIQLGLFKVSGVSTIDQTLDKVLTGIIIGSGTKPLHDLISYVQKASTKKGGK